MFILSILHSDIDHDDPSKPSHRWTNGPEPSKTIESDGRKIKNHRKTIDGNGQTAKKHSMVMVSSKTIENLQWSLQNHWNLQWFPKNHWTCQWSSQINILLKEWNYPVVTITILIWLFCRKVYCQSSLIFIAVHCSCKPNLPHPTNHFACYYTATSSPPQLFI